MSKEGFEAIPHVTARPSSTAGLIDQIRTAFVFFQVKNYLIITGDPYREYEAQAVFHTDSLGIIRRLNEHFRNREGVCDIALGAAVNQNHRSLEAEGHKIKTKEDSGVDFFMSQPVFDMEQVKSLIEFYKQHSSNPLIVGIWPLIYESMIENIRSGKIKGVVIPDEVYHQTKGKSEELRSWALAEAGYLIEDLKSNLHVQGVYIVSPARNLLYLRDLLIRVLR